MAEQLGHLVALFIGKSGVTAVALGVLEVYFLVCNVQIAAYNDGLLFVKTMQVSLEVVFPSHAIVKPTESVLSVGRIHRDEEEVVIFKGYDASFIGSFRA